MVSFVIQGVAAIALLALSRLPLLAKLRRFGFPLALLAVSALLGVFVEWLVPASAWWDQLAHGCQVIVLVFLATSMILRLLFDWLGSRRRGGDFPGLGRDLISIVVYVVLLAVLLKVLFNVELTAVLATSAILTVIVGLALQQTLGSLFSGIVLAIEGKAAPGQWVRSGGVIGRVEEHGWRSLVLRTTTDRLVMVPNSAIAGEHLDLLGNGDLSMAVNVHLGVTYKAAPDEVRDVLLAVARDLPLVLPSPPPRVLTLEFADSAITYECRLWTRYPWEEMAIRSEFLTRAYRALERAGMEIPFPQRSVHVVPPASPVAREPLIRAALAACDLFQGLPDEALSMLSHDSHLHTFAPGEAVIHEGELSTAMFVVASGEAVAIRTVKGEESEVGRQQVGTVFGDIAFVLGLPRTATVRAADRLEVVEIGVDSLRALLSQLPDLGEELARRVALRKARLDEEIQRESAEPPAQTIKDMLKSLLRVIGLGTSAR